MIDLKIFIDTLFRFYFVSYSLAFSLGMHLEGPFISKEKRGAHPAKYIKDLDDGFETVLKTYGNLDHVSIVTLAPETDNCLGVIKLLAEKGIRVSLGRLCESFNQ